MAVGPEDARAVRREVRDPQSLGPQRHGVPTPLRELEDTAAAGIRTGRRPVYAGFGEHDPDRLRLARGEDDRIAPAEWSLHDRAALGGRPVDVGLVAGNAQCARLLLGNYVGGAPLLGDPHDRLSVVVGPVDVS